ncbi:hypothetical protein TDB9533_01309 [Thalassocella blandensis]|nr:hypothetical protein TDB9533_01309 [Thalassocella blandensis]
MIFDQDEHASVVFFFSDDSEVVREMNYAEYQAILDGYVPAVDLANRDLNAVYVEFNAKYKVVATVFFLVRFTSLGYVDDRWSVPLMQLARFASKGPDLGAGPVRLVCASRCPMKQYTAGLWDPDLRSGKGEFKGIAEAVKRNRVGIMFRDPDPEQLRQEKEAEEARQIMEKSIAMRLRNKMDQEFRDHMAQVIKEQRLRTQTILNDKERYIRDLKVQQNARVEDYRTMLEEQKRMLEQERERNAALKETIEGQAQKIQGLREYFEVKLEKAEGSEQDQLEQLKQNYEMEMDAHVEAATTELKEMLQLREVELLYRSEQETKLLEEINTLREQNQGLVDNSGDNILSKLMEKGVSFVTYQPGAGHITLPVSDISSYLENPTAYVASFCGVTEAHYNAWLEHYHVPICRATHSSGEMCGENIHRVESPVDFVFGETDCCHKHRKNKSPQLKVAGSNP